MYEFMTLVHGMNVYVFPKILSQIVNDRLDNSEDMEEDSESPLNFTFIATQTEGYSATDLQDLVARAMHQAAVRVATRGQLVSLLPLG